MSRSEPKEVGYAGQRLLPAEVEEFSERQLPKECNARRVRVEVNRRGRELTVRVRTPRDVWTVEVEREHARIFSNGHYRPTIPRWAARLLNRMDVDPTMDWRELVGEDN